MGSISLAIFFIFARLFQCAYEFDMNMTATTRNLLLARGGTIFDVCGIMEQYKTVVLIKTLVKMTAVT